MGSLTTGQMYDHVAFPRRGWVGLHTPVVPYTFAAGEKITAGRVCYRNSSGEFKLGLAKNTLAHIAITNSDMPGISVGSGSTSTEIMGAYPLVWPFEIESTEFDSDQTFAINDYLTAWDATSTPTPDKEKYGLVCKGTVGTHTIIGQVSESVAKNEYKKDILCFWTMNIPATA